MIRKELDVDDRNYQYEVAVLSTLQRMNHPNILKLVACYTVGQKHNLVSPHITQGTLKELFAQRQLANLEQWKLFNLLAGLASALWALHQIFDKEDGAPLKGLHADLRPVNVLYDGDRLILADFGLSRIKPASELSQTEVKARIDYYQAPECTPLEDPWDEGPYTRASDMFALGCMVTEVIVHIVKGHKGWRRFETERTFKRGEFTYHLFHTGNAINPAVSKVLEETANASNKRSIGQLADYALDLLDIDPLERPDAETFTKNLYKSTVAAFGETIQDRFAALTWSAGVAIEMARFRSWEQSFAKMLHPYSSAAELASKFEEVLACLQCLDQVLGELPREDVTQESRSLLRVQQLNGDLIDFLPVEGQQQAASTLLTCIVMPSGTKDAALLEDVLMNSIHGHEIAMMLSTKRKVASLEHGTAEVNRRALKIVPGRTPLVFTEVDQIGSYRLGIVTGKAHPWLVLEEPLRTLTSGPTKAFQTRIAALCNLLSQEDMRKKFRTLPIYGLHKEIAGYEIGLLYDLGDLPLAAVPKSPAAISRQLKETKIVPVVLRQLLQTHADMKRPSLDTRFQIAFKLAEAVAALHDVNWYHKDLTSNSILFLGQDAVTLHEPHIIGFRHSRDASLSSSDGPPVDKEQHRCHHPDYVTLHGLRYDRFKPEYDHYSLGILLLEVGLWRPFSEIITSLAKSDNALFSQALLAMIPRDLEFAMGHTYANAVTQCLQPSPNEDEKYKALRIPASARPNLRFKERVVTPLQELSDRFKQASSIRVVDGASQQLRSFASPTSSSGLEHKKRRLH